MDIDFILVKQSGDHRWNIEEGSSQTFKMCQMRGGFIKNVPKKE